VSAELGTAEFQNFQSGLNRPSDIPGRAARRTDLAWRAFRAADEAKPEAARDQDRRNLCGKTRALLLFVEDMEAAAIEDKMEGSLGRRGQEEVQGAETATEIAAIQLCRGSFDRVRRDVDPQDVESAFREPKGIRPCPRANLERPGGPNATRRDEVDQ
jgi:hypothetical protein